MIINTAGSKDNLSYLIFDFDGTLADTSTGIHASFIKAASSIGQKSPNFTEFKNMIGPDLTSLIKLIYPKIDESDLTEFVRVFREAYDLEDCKKIIWYKGLDKILKAISSNMNWHTGIVTNKPTLPCEKLLKMRGIRSYFDYVIGIDYLRMKGASNNFTNKAGALKYAIQISEVNSNQIIYVGDTKGDQKACNEASIRFIAANYGFTNWVNSQKATPIIQNLEELLDILDIKN